MWDLNDLYSDLLGNGSRLEAARAISPDGRYIVGQGYNSTTGRREAYLLDRGCPRSADVDHDGIVDDADLLIVLFNFGARAVIHISRQDFYPTAVDDNGTVFGVKSSDPSQEWYSAYWRPETGIQVLSGFGTLLSFPYGCNSSGTVVVGRTNQTTSSNDSIAFRWQNGNISHVASSPSTAIGVSEDGNTIVGGLGVYNIFSGWQGTAFLWHNNTLTNLGGVLANRNAYAVDVTNVGSQVHLTGSAQNSSGQWRAFRLVYGSSPQDLGTLGGNQSYAYAISRDGSTIVGTAQLSNGEWRAFRWNRGMMMPIATEAFGWTSSTATGVSRDGLVVIGQGKDAQGKWRLFRWSAFGGLENLSEKYSLPSSGDHLIVSLINPFAKGLSPSGRYVICMVFGSDDSAGAYLIDTQLEGDVNGDGIVDDADLLEVLFSFGSQCI